MGYCRCFMVSNMLGVLAHTCNPSILGGQGGQITRGQEFKTSLANMLLIRLRQENRLNLADRGCDNHQEGVGCYCNIIMSVDSALAFGGLLDDLLVLSMFMEQRMPVGAELVAEMHGELIEFNERLHRALVAKEALVSQMRQELIDLRGP
ncbi:Sorting nexin-29, partial [Plecturocebus cupreus]